MTSIKFDRYTIFARLIPALVAIAPAIALVAAIIPWTKLSLSDALAVVPLGVLFMVFPDLARRRGRAVEPHLILRMGGLPSIVMMRHNDPSFDKASKARLHSFLSLKLNEPSPTESEEAADLSAADGFYSRGGTWLRENTRNQKDFSLLHSESITYGFRRNLYGLRLPTLFLDAAILVGFLASFYFGLAEKYWATGALVITIAVLHAIYLVCFATESSASDAARIYARQLILSAGSPKLAEKKTIPRKGKTK